MDPGGGEDVKGLLSQGGWGGGGGGNSCRDFGDSCGIRGHFLMEFGASSRVLGHFSQVPPIPGDSHLPKNAQERLKEALRAGRFLRSSRDFFGTNQAKIHE